MIDHKEWGFTDADLEREFYIFDNHTAGITNQPNKKFWKLKDIIYHLNTIYCKNIGY